ncbi:MAG TPA: hypothetical protein V6D05_01925 [Stenomitos sp.]
MRNVMGREQDCVVLGVSDKNGITDDHPLDLDEMKDLLVVDLDYFLANERHVASMVGEALRHRARDEANYTELKEERDALRQRLDELRRLAKDYRPTDTHICPEDVLAITGE